jgi:hypothetical protein
MKPGDRVILQGEVADFRGDFALVTVSGSAPDSGYLSIDCGSFELVDDYRAVLHGAISAIRGRFVVTVVDGSLPPGSMISIARGSLELEDAGERPASGA